MAFYTMREGEAVAIALEYASREYIAVSRSRSYRSAFDGHAAPPRPRLDQPQRIPRQRRLKRAVVCFGPGPHNAPFGPEKTQKAEDVTSTFYLVCTAEPVRAQFVVQ